MKNLDDHSWFTVGSSPGNTNSDKAPAALSPPRYVQGTARSAWSNRFIIAAIVQGAVITGLTLAFVAAQMLTSEPTSSSSSHCRLKVRQSGSSSGTFFT